jgi:deoxyribodipyrimidine photolyase-related protein
VPPPVLPVEDEIDEQVRADLDRWAADGDVAFVGDDGPRLFPVTPAEADARLRDFLDHRLREFGPIEDAMLAEEPWLAHSLLSATPTWVCSTRGRSCTAPSRPGATRWPPATRCR